MALRGLAQFKAVATTHAPSDSEPLIRQTGAPAQPLSRVFAYQSYFDNTLLSRAILPQNTNDPIVASTMKREQIPGYSLGLHPSSQTPVAVQFTLGGQTTSSQAIVLSPGQIVRPHGLPRNVQDGSFSGFTWGLPFGWLGGGLATLIVFPSADADASWQGRPEILFHRQRIQIEDLAALPANADKNWPLRFPWEEAVSGSASSLQQGSPVIAVEPTRTILRLRLGTLAAAADMRIIYQETQDFDLDSAGAVIATPVTAYDVTWGTWASVGAGNLGTQYQMLSLQDQGWRLGADLGGVTFASSAASLIDQYVDVCRYGKL